MGQDLAPSSNQLILARSAVLEGNCFWNCSRRNEGMFPCRSDRRWLEADLSLARPVKAWKKDWKRIAHWSD